jgi:hypothetical protein
MKKGRRKSKKREKDDDRATKNSILLSLKPISGAATELLESSLKLQTILL